MTRERVLVSKCRSGKMYVPFSPAAIHSPRAAQEGGKRRSRIPGAVCCGSTSTSERRRAHLAACEQETYERSACEHNDERLPACRRWEVRRCVGGAGGLVCRLHACVFEKLRVGSEGMLAPREEVISLTFCFFSVFCFMLFSHQSTGFV